MFGKGSGDKAARLTYSLVLVDFVKMGEFHDAVSTLLQAFSNGISVIRTQRGRRKKDRIPIDPPRKEAESSLSKSLKRNRTDVKKEYERDVALLGPGFAVGDG